MSTRGEKSLAVRAHQQIGICCETLCEKSVVQAYIHELEEKVERLERENKIFREQFVAPDIRTKTYE